MSSFQNILLEVSKPSRSRVINEKICNVLGSDFIIVLRMRIIIDLKRICFMIISITFCRRIICECSQFSFLFFKLKKCPCGDQKLSFSRKLVEFATCSMMTFFVFCKNKANLLYDLHPQFSSILDLEPCWMKYYHRRFFKKSISLDKQSCSICSFKQGNFWSTKSLNGIMWMFFSMFKANYHDMEQ